MHKHLIIPQKMKKQGSFKDADNEKKDSEDRDPKVKS